MTHTSFYKNVNFFFFVGSGGCGDLQQHNVHNKCWNCIFLQTIDMFKLYASSCLKLQCIRWTWSGTLAVNSSGLVECWVGPSMVSNECSIWRVLKARFFVMFLEPLLNGICCLVGHIIPLYPTPLGSDVAISRCTRWGTHVRVTSAWIPGPSRPLNCNKMILVIRFTGSVQWF